MTPAEILVKQAEILEWSLAVSPAGEKYGLVLDKIAELRSQAAALPPVGAQEEVDWDKFPGYLIDHCEGNVISEEFLQKALADMLRNPQYRAKENHERVD